MPGYLEDEDVTGNGLIESVVMYCKKCDKEVIFVIRASCPDCGESIESNDQSSELN